MKDGSTFSEQTQLWILNQLEGEYVTIGQCVGAPEGQEAARAKLTGLREVSRPPNCRGETHATNYQPPQAI